MPRVRRHGGWGVELACFVLSGLAMASTFRELVVWQQADALRRAIWLVVKRSADMDLRFRSQWTDAARSVCSNTAEGFRRRSHRDFARYLEFAASSLAEVDDLIDEAVIRGHVSSGEAAELQLLVRRTSAPLSRLLAYLRHSPGRPGRDR